MPLTTYSSSMIGTASDTLAQSCYPVDDGFVEIETG